MRYGLYIFLLTCFACFRASGQPDTNYWVHYDISNYLPSNNIYSCMQDRNGYMWFATDNGVVKYNGYSFKSFNTTTGLPSNDVWRMHEDTHGRLWLYSLSYRFGYIKNDKYKEVNIGQTKDSRILRPEFVGEANHNIYFFLQNNKYIVSFDTNDKVTIINYNPKNFYNAIGNDTSLYVFPVGRSIIKYRLKDFTTSIDGLGKIDAYANERVVENSYRFVIDKHLFSSAYRGDNIKTINLATGIYREYKKADLGMDSNEYMYVFVPSRDKTFLMITNKCIRYFDLDMQLLKKENFIESLPAYTQVSYHVVDSFKNNWYTTNTEGVWFKSRTSELLRKSVLSHQLKNVIYVGRVRGGTTFWWNSVKATMYAIDKDLNIKYSHLFDDDIRNIVADKDTNNLIVAFRNGVFRFDVVHKKLKKVELRNYFINVDKGSGTAQWRRKNIDTVRNYIFQNYFTIHKYDSCTVMAASHLGVIKLKLIPGTDSGDIYAYNNDRLTNIVYDSVCKLYWAHNSEGITLVDPVKDKWVSFSKDALPLIGINSFSGLAADSFGNIFILTKNRIFLFNTISKQHKSLLFNIDLTSSFMGIRNNVLFVCGRFGVAYATVQGKGSISSFKIIPNPKNSIYKRVYDIALNKYKLILNTESGFYTIQVPDLFTTRTAFDPSDRNFMLLTLNINGAQKTIRNRDTLYLPVGTQKVQLDLINYIGSGERTYYYKIPGYANWQETQSGELFLPNLKPDVYYEVICYAKDEVWRSNNKHIYIYKMPKWWQTSGWRTIIWIAAVVALVLVVLGIVLLTRSIVARANRKKRQLLELELRAIHSQINPHFIFNTLSAALFFISRNKMSEAYTHVNKFSRLLRSYLKSSRDRYVTLAEEIEMLRNYIELQQIRFEQKFEYVIELENKVPADNVQIPSLLLQPLVENAINHGLFHLPEEYKGLLVIKFFQGASSNELVCTIDDNGVGRNRAKDIKRESTVQYESYGTKLTEELIDIFAQYERMDIVLEYIDKQDPDSGTIVKLTIKNLKYLA